MTSSRTTPSRVLLRLLAAVLGALTVLGIAGSAVPGLARAGTPTGGGSPDASAPDRERLVEILPVEGYLDPPTVGAIISVIEGADQRGSHLVVIQVDSPVAMSADVDALLETIRRSRVPVVVYVGPRGADAQAGGAAALALAAADIGAMASDATVGPAVPVDLAGPEDPGELPVPDVLRDEQVGVERAEELGMVEVVAGGLEPLLVELDGRTVDTDGTTTLRIRGDEITPRLHSLGLIGRLAHAAAHPVVTYLALAAGLAMLLFEVFQPGFGVAGVAGLVTVAVGAYGLTVLPVTWWALALLIGGLILYAIDAAVAGFGPVTVAATASFAAGSWWLYDAPILSLGWPVVAGTTAAAWVFFVVVLTVVLRAQAPPEEAAIEDLVGRVGMVRSTLNPEGHVYIDDALWRARWTGEGTRVGVGTPIRVHDVDGPVVLVEAFDAEEARAAGGGGEGSDPGGEPGRPGDSDAPTDGGSDAGGEARTDAGSDAGTDAGSEARTDAESADEPGQ